jgi:hypothetical protein
MHATKTAWFIGIAGSLVMVVALVVLSGFSAALAWMSSGSDVGDPCWSSTSVAGGANGGSTSPPSLVASPTAGGNGSQCVAPVGYGAAVVQWARAMADALYVNPACNGQISYPTCYDTWYKAPGGNYPPGAPFFPQAVILYGDTVCPGCSAWANGTYQCVSFVRGAYSQVFPMNVTGNAFDLWALYSQLPGWMEVPSGSAPASQRGLPLPGDVMVFKDPSIGHVAIVMAVQLPHGSQDGAITFSNANSVSPYTTMPLLPDLSVDTSSWPGYTVWGYIRPRIGTSSAATQTQQDTLTISFAPFPPRRKEAYA